MLEPDMERSNAWGRLAMLSQLRWRRGEHWLKVRRLRRGQMSRSEAIILSALALPGLISIERRRQRRILGRGRYRGMEDLLDRERPDVVIHPSAFNGVYVNDLVLACRERGIPSIVIMNSWDNPSTKNTVDAHPDRLLVWGRQTAEHARRFMGIAPERIAVMGAAQFDIYTHRPAFDRGAFAASLGVDPNRKTLLYGASSILGGDHQRLRVIDAWCRGRGADAPQVVYRPYPWRRMEGEIAAILAEPWSHVHIQHSALRAKGDGDAGEAAKERFAALMLADGVISPLSTILLEGMLLERPVLCVYPEREMKLEFTPANAPLAHFQEIFRNQDVVMVRSDDEMGRGLDRLMDNLVDARVRESLSVTVRQIVAPFDRPYAERLCAYVEARTAPPTETASSATRTWAIAP
jgi:hypothetical protein